MYEVVVRNDRGLLVRDRVIYCSARVAEREVRNLAKLGQEAEVRALS